jgi:hypothetical protein
MVFNSNLIFPTHKSNLDTLGNSLSSELDTENPFIDQIESLRKDGLQEIANEDFRGNRSSGSVKAFIILNSLKKGKNED